MANLVCQKDVETIADTILENSSDFNKQTEIDNSVFLKKFLKEASSSQILGVLFYVRNKYPSRVEKVISLMNLTIKS